MAHEPRQHCIDAGLEVAKTLNLPVWRFIVGPIQLERAGLRRQRTLQSGARCGRVVFLVEWEANAVALASDGRSVTLQPAAERAG
jgi:hypothetical protein